MMPRWLRLALGFETDAEDSPVVCPTCHGRGRVRRSLLDDPEWRAVDRYLHDPDATAKDLARWLDPAGGGRLRA